jgi:hypothetical protein
MYEGDNMLTADYADDTVHPRNPRLGFAKA